VIEPGHLEELVEDGVRAIWEARVGQPWDDERSEVSDDLREDLTTALLAILPENFTIYEADHWCTPGCGEGCDIRTLEHWAGSRVVAHSEPLTPEEIRDLFGDILRDKDGD